ncbi:YunG family protein [Halocatena marina]|uniref:YunG family protein n=1 Tax=Halocatena marina TaxID=2934937 RepID=UPI00200F4558|nr:hypothetical protein [Halocatena marina]
MEFDEENVLRALRKAWSPESSSLWTEENPARGQCGVTALVLQDHFGGEIRKTPTDGGLHFYNIINDQRCDLTADQFDQKPEYLDQPSNRDEAFGDTNAHRYAILTDRFEAVLSAEGYDP